MLVLSRKQGESINIDSDVEIEVLEIRGGRVRLGFRAPQSRRIIRSEVVFRTEFESLKMRSAAQSDSSDQQFRRTRGVPVRPAFSKSR